MGIEEMRAQLARLKSTSFKLSEEKEEEARIAREIVAEQERIDAEGQAALGKIAVTREAEAWASIPEAQRSTTMLHTVYDWPTHKQTMINGDISTGLGIIVVRSLDGAAAAKSLRQRSKLSGGSEFNLYDGSTEAMTAALMKATVYPSLDVLQEMLVKCEPLCRNAYQAAMFISGALAHDVTGKSNG